MLPSWIGSSTPVTVTVCATFQFAGEIGRASCRAGASVRVVDDNLIRTLAVGWVFKNTANVAVPLASVVVRRDVRLLVISTSSLSSFVPDTSDAFRLV